MSYRIVRLEYLLQKAKNSSLNEDDKTELQHWLINQDHFLQNMELEEKSFDIFEEPVENLDESEMRAVINVLRMNYSDIKEERNSLKRGNELLIKRCAEHRANIDQLLEDSKRLNWELDMTMKSLIDETRKKCYVKVDES